MQFWNRGLDKKRVYADAAAATPLGPRSRREMLRLLDLYGNAGALHQEGVVAKKELEQARKTIANSIGAHADEIVFTASGTEGNNLALHGALRPLLLERGEVSAITCAIEHLSILEPLRALEREGLYTTVLPVDSAGIVAADALADAVNEQTALVSVQLVNSEVGTIEPLREMAKKIRKMRASRQAQGEQLPLYFHTDASQAPLWVGINVEQLGVDLMTLDAQKVLGPKGIGALYIRRGTHVEPILWGGSQEHGLRGGTPNVPLAGAFAVALADAQTGVEERAQNIAEVRDYCFEEIKKLIPDALLNGPELGDARVANNINVSVPGLAADMAVVALDVEGVAASTRSACNIGEEEPSHVIQALGVPPELAGTAIRITLLPDATKRQARFVAEALAAVAARYRQ